MFLGFLEFSPLRACPLLHLGAWWSDCLAPPWISSLEPSSRVLPELGILLAAPFGTCPIWKPNPRNLFLIFRTKWQWIKSNPTLKFKYGENSDPTPSRLLLSRRTWLKQIWWFPLFFFRSHVLSRSLRFSLPQNFTSSSSTKFLSLAKSHSDSLHLPALIHSRVFSLSFEIPF